MRPVPTTQTQWAAEVIARDGRCKECSATEDLHAHRTYRNAPLTLDNGLTYCGACLAQIYARTRVRARSERPQRRTLERRIDQLTAENEELKAENLRLRQRGN